MPEFDGFPIHSQIPEVMFEAAVYDLLHSVPDIMVPRLLYHRLPTQHDGPRLNAPQDLAGRCLLLFEQREGQNNVWRNINPAQRVSLCSVWMFISTCTKHAYFVLRLFYLQMLPAFAQSFLLLSFHLILQASGFENDCSSRSPRLSRYLLAPRATFVFHLLLLRSKRQLVL
jgi:hypothetical protein